MSISKLGLVLLGGLCAFFSNEATAQHFEQHWSGWSMGFVNDTNSGLVSNLAGKGTFGRAENHAVIESTFAGSCDTGGFLLNNTLHTNIMRVRSGDLLHRIIRSSPSSPTCVDLTAQKATATVYLEIVGGTGKFENARGFTVLTLDVQILNGQNSVVGHEVGEIFLNED